MLRTSNKIPKLHIKKGDTVKVLSGDDKGKTGKVVRVFLKKGKAIVEGVNMVTRHLKPSQNNPQGQILNTEAPLPVCKLQLVVNGKPTRVGRKKTETGWVRVAKKTGDIIK